MPAETGADIEVKKEDLGTKGFPVTSGKTHRLVLPTSAIDWTLKDAEGNPCSFFRYELKFKPAATGPVPPPVRGFLDENGRLFIDPAPIGEFDISVFDELGRVVSAKRLWIERGAGA